MDFEILINICIIYSIKRLYTIPKGYSQLFYILFCSPIVLCNGLYNTNVVSKKYWKFLRLLSYPDIKDVSPYKGNCDNFHPYQKDCYDLIQFNRMFNTVSFLYLKYYSIHGIYLLIFKGQGLKNVLFKEVSNMVKSTSFLFLQNALQRLALCSIPNIQPRYMYLITTACSSPIIFENESRVSHINTMMLSNITIGSINKFLQNYKNNITLVLFLTTLYKNKKLHIPTLILSILSGLTQYSLPKCKSQSNKSKVDEYCPVLDLPWHPFL
jgi:hypothetical protein